MFIAEFDKIVHYSSTVPSIQKFLMWSPKNGKMLEPSFKFGLETTVRCKDEALKSTRQMRI